MRPALEVCGACHWPNRPIRDPVKMIREYADDETNSETITTLQMFVGGPGQPTASGHAIHWHADPSIRVEYVATDETFQVIPYVKVTDAQGRVREYQAEGTRLSRSLRGPAGSWTASTVTMRSPTGLPPPLNGPSTSRSRRAESIDGFHSSGVKGCA